MGEMFTSFSLFLKLKAAARKVGFSCAALVSFTESLAQSARQLRFRIGGDGVGEDGNHPQGVHGVILPYRREMFLDGDGKIGARRPRFIAKSRRL